jgi:5S rRNA maturation endonuclease (ribonuclease M5)
VSFFDKKGEVLKELVMKKLKKIEGQLVPVEMVMKNVQKGSQTVLRVNQIDSKAKLTDADFTEAAMKQ